MHVSELPVHRTQLDNGLRVICVPRQELHAVCGGLYLAVGPTFETPSTNGLSHVLEHMLFRGTSRFPSAHSLALAVERLGATLYAETRTDNGHLSLTLPPSNVAEGMALLAQVVADPIFSDLEVERGILREEVLEGLDDRGNCVDCDDLCRALLFENHPLGMPIAGTLANIDRVDLDALKQHYRAFYTANNLVLAVAGPVDVVSCFALAREHFGSLPTAKQGLKYPLPPPSQGHAQFQFVDNPGSQTDVRVAFRAPGRDDDMRDATELLVRLLDDGMSTRVYAKVCDEKGLCYDVSADYEPYGTVGVLDFAAAAHHDRALLVVQTLVEIVTDLVVNGPTERELRVAKNRHHWAIEALLDHCDGLADYHGSTELMGHGITLRERRDRVEAVTLEQVWQAAKAAFRPDQCAITAVGKLRRSQRLLMEKSLELLEKAID